MDAAEKTYNDQVMVMAQIKTWGQYIVSVFVIAFLPAVFEETFFRGGIQQLLGEARYWQLLLPPLFLALSILVGTAFLQGPL